jgi:hypothetical protein
MLIPVQYSLAGHQLALVRRLVLAQSLITASSLLAQWLKRVRI